MTQRPMPLTLPPPVIFTHDETLHAIRLPPLASFLTSLTAPDQLVKLNDILDRFRTPDSYHRIDVRVVESSELPPNSPEDLEGDERERREKGAPVTLPPGMEVVDYLALQSLSDRSTAPADGALMNGHEKARTPTDSPLSDLPLDYPLGFSREAILAPPFPPSSSVIHPPARTTRSNHSPPTPSYPLAPSGPGRRVRELRVDLRTLDAAALFTLENWRRQSLGLNKLDMDVPDSVWYQDPAPSPSPPPPPPKKKRGRPRKSVPNTMNGEMDESDNINTEDYSALAEALRSNGFGDGGLLDLGVDGVMTEDTVREALDQLAHQSGVDALVSSLEDRHADNSNALTSGTGITPPPALVGEPSPNRSPSPDVILEDAFDEQEVNDPDFALPVRSTSERNSSVETGEEVEVSRKRRPRHSAPTRSTALFATGPLEPSEAGPSRRRDSAPTDGALVQMDAGLDGPRRKRGRPRKSGRPGTMPLSASKDTFGESRVPDRVRSDPEQSLGPEISHEADVDPEPPKKRRKIVSVEIPTVGLGRRKTPPLDKAVHFEPEKEEGSSLQDESGDEWGFLRDM